MAKLISFQTWNKQNYLCADRALNGRLVADRTQAYEWELFNPIPLEKEWYALQSTNGKYVCAEQGGGRELIANRDAIGDWEKFRITPSNNGVSIQTINGYYVCAEQGGGGLVVANRTSPGVWETLFPSENFLIEKNPVNQTLHTDRQIFRLADGTPLRHKGVTAFKLLDLFSRGIDLSSFLTAYKRYRSVRIFPYVPVNEWGAKAWNVPSYATVKDFIQYLGNLGWYVHLNYITDNNPRRLEEAKALIKYLNQFNFPNLLNQGVNEPYVKSDSDKIDPVELKNSLTSSPYLYTSGVYSNLKRFYGKFGVHHSGRDNEWVRKAKDAVEAYRGGGPNSPDEPACPVPWILDEPIRPEQCLAMGFTPEQVRLDYYTYALISSGGAAGATFHCETAKFAEPPTEFEYQCSQAFADGLEKLPEDAALSRYDRIDEGQDTLRTYVFGQYIIRVRPRKDLPFPSTWKSLDDFGILFKH